MFTYPIGESRWRMLARVRLAGRVKITFGQVRDMRRADTDTLDSLVRAGLLIEHGKPTENKDERASHALELTPAGREASILGLVTYATWSLIYPKTEQELAANKKKAGRKLTLVR